MNQKGFLSSKHLGISIDLRPTSLLYSIDLLHRVDDGRLTSASCLDSTLPPLLIASLCPSPSWRFGHDGFDDFGRLHLPFMRD